MGLFHDYFFDALALTHDVEAGREVAKLGSGDIAEHCHALEVVNVDRSIGVGHDFDDTGILADSYRA